MKYYYILVLITFCFFSGCIFNKDKPIVIDSIEFDQSLDNPHFELCQDRVYQYFNDSKGLLFKGDKPALEEAFFGQYVDQNIIGESGLIRIRFVVNCMGKSDRFRLIGMNNNYEKKIFNSKISAQLLNITKNINGWGIMKIKGKPLDYYQYLIFVIEDGNLTNILP